MLDLVKECFVTLVCISRAEGCYKFDMAGEPRRITDPWHLGLLVACNLVIFILWYCSEFCDGLH